VSASTTSSAASTHRYFSTFELLLLGMFAALIVAGNFALRFPIRMPGHSGIVWMALLVTAATVVPKRGAATTAAGLSGILAAFVGVGDRGPLDTVLSYAAAGAGVDVVLVILRGRGRAVSSLIAGGVGNLTKLAVKMLLESWIGIPTGFVLLGKLYPAATHLLFGLAGGYLGFLVVDALRRAGFFAYLAEKR
jgi:ABC-type thiamin/hydroxymethylpyrimidine transport system permease subunit